jgi:c-di-GMP-binding flagellar brake protein YcgR
MAEHTIQWNAAKEEWLCVRCLRSSDQIKLEDAQNELNQFDCLVAVNLEPKNILNERRQTARQKISVQVEMVLRGRSIPMRTTITDLSLGGCYVENTSTLPVGFHLTLTLWLGEHKIKVEGLVKTCDPALGNGIEFVNIQPSNRAKLQGYLSASAEP